MSAIAELLHQLRYAPPERKRRQMDAAEALLADIRAESTYPEDFIVFRITSYRPNIESPALFVGTGLLADLPTFIERLSHDLALPASAFPGREPVPIDEVLAELKISRSTLNRYRKAGLVAHHVVLEGVGQRLVVFRDVLERFVGERPQQVERASQFSRIDAATRARMIARARRYERSLGWSLNEAAGRLAVRFDRSHEAVRQVLMRHDAQKPGEAIFDHRGPLTPRDHRVALRASDWGVPVTRLAERLNRNRNRVYQAINIARAERLQSWPIEPVMFPTFQMDEADRVILASVETRTGFEPLRRGLAEAAAALAVTPAAARPGSTSTSHAGGHLHGGAVAVSESTESVLFGAMNYLMFDVRKRRDEIDAAEPRAADLDLLETRLRWATRLKRRLMFAHLGLVVRTLEVHAGRPLAVLPSNVAGALFALGVGTMSEAVDRFDAGGTTRFSAYLNLQLRRALARSPLHDVATASATRAARAVRPESAPPLPEPACVLHPWQRAIDFPGFLLGRLDRLEREAQRSTGIDGALALAVLELRYSLTKGEAPRTIAETAEVLDRTPTVVAATETRARRRLRGLATATSARALSRRTLRKQRPANVQSSAPEGNGSVPP